MAEARVIYIDDSGISTVVIDKNVPDAAIAGIMFRSTVTLTNDQIKALPTTPVEIIPAQGANTFINVLSAILVQSWPTNYGTLSADPKLVIGIQGLSQSNAFFVIDEATYAFFSLPFGNPPGICSASNIALVASGSPLAIAPIDESQILNVPFVVSVDNGASGNFSLGGSSNYLTLTAEYTVITV